MAWPLGLSLTPFLDTKQSKCNPSAVIPQTLPKASDLSLDFLCADNHAGSMHKRHNMLKKKMKAHFILKYVYRPLLLSLSSFSLLLFDPSADHTISGLIFVTTHSVPPFNSHSFSHK